MKKSSLLLLLPILLTSCNSAPQISKEDALLRLEKYKEHLSILDNMDNSSIATVSKYSKLYGGVATIEKISKAYNDKKDIYYESRVKEFEGDPSSKETNTRWIYLVINNDGSCTEYIASYYSYKGTVTKEYQMSTIITPNEEDYLFEKKMFLDYSLELIDLNIVSINRTVETNDDAYYGSWIEQDLICDIKNKTNKFELYSTYTENLIQTFKYVDEKNASYISTEVTFGYETFTPTMPDLKEYTLKPYVI